MSTDQTLHFPKELVIRVIDEVTGLSVSDIAITLTLYAARKNNYDLGPALSDATGTIVIARAWVEKAIFGIKSFFLMDYDSTMQQCYSHITLRVDSPEDIRKAIVAMKLYGEVAQELGIAYTISGLDRAINYKYTSQTVQIDLAVPNEERREIIVRLRPKS